jgi:hypothetical protein
MRAAALLLLGWAATGCAAPQIQPSTPQSCVVGVRIRIQDPSTYVFVRPDLVYFVRFEPGADPTRIKEVIESNHRDGETIYLRDAKPGRYALVAGYEVRRGRRYTTQFPAEFIRHSMVDVKAGETVIMGEAKMETSTLAKNRDRAQEHYFNVINAQLIHATTMVRFFGRDQVNWGKTTKLRDRPANPIVDRRPERAEEPATTPETESGG